MDNAENTKFCSQCGAKIPAEAKFCGECGFRFPEEPKTEAPVEEESKEPKAEAPVEEVPKEPVVQPAQQPLPPLTGGFTQPAQETYPMQPAANPYMQNPYPAYSPVQQPAKKGKGGLIAIISAIVVLAAVAVVLIMGIAKGWFGGFGGGEKDALELSEVKVTVEADDEYTVEVTNYKDLGKPELTVTSSDEDIAVAEVNKGEITIIGVEEGRATITVEAKGCETAEIKVTVEEATGSSGGSSDIAIEGSAWNADGMKFYFLDNGMMYLIYENSEDYIKGSYTVLSITADEADSATDNAEQAMSEVLSDCYGSDVPSGNYYRIDVDMEQEILYGNVYTEEECDDDYHVIVWTDGNDCAIYDSGWNRLNTGSSTSMLSESELEEYFENAAAGSGVTSGSVPGISFGDQTNVKETWHIALYRDGNADILIYKRDGNLWGLNENTEAAQAITDLASGTQITLFAVYEDYLFYGVGSDDQFYSDTEAFYRVDLSNDEITMIADDSTIVIKDFVIMNDIIYYTDYSELYKMNLDGSDSELLWDYGVYTFEVTEDSIYVFDGYGWEVLNTDDGYSEGYLAMADCDYEADVVREEDGYLFYTICEYGDYSDTIWLYALDEDGNAIRIGDGDEGESWDTYNLVFDGKYAYHTANGGEMIIKTDVTTGDYSIVFLNDYDDYYYATGMVMLDDKIALYAWDYSGDAHYLWLDMDDLSVEEIPGVSAD